MANNIANGAILVAFIAAITFSVHKVDEGHVAVYYRVESLLIPIRTF